VPGPLYAAPMPDFSRVSRRADAHLYMQIARAIEEAITTGELRPRDPIPSEKDIMDATAASRSAVRHAVAYLREKGVVYTIPHLGTFVSPPQEGTPR
jgi:GntR family transcriptional regulator